MRRQTGSATPRRRDTRSGAGRPRPRQARPARRFYTEAGFAEDPDGFRLTLDGRPANTPARNPLRLPTRTLAERVAAEWAAQEEQIDPARMPLTRIVNTAIDGVAPRLEAVAADLCAYAGTDLVAYRAGDPERLVAAQAAAWDPILAWARETFGARVILSEGVMHVTQRPTPCGALSDAVEAVTDPFRLAGLHTLTTLTGSLLIALAVLEGRLTAAEAWPPPMSTTNLSGGGLGPRCRSGGAPRSRRAEFEAAAELVALRR